MRLTRKIVEKNIATGDELTGPYWQCGLVDVTAGGELQHADEMWRSLVAAARREEPSGVELVA